MTTETLDSIGFFTAPAVGSGSDVAPASPQAASTLSHPESWFTHWMTGGASADGCDAPVVNEQTVLNYLAVYSCVNLIARSLSSVPLIVYRRDRDLGTIERASDSRIYGVLRDQFNPRMSAVVARQTLTAHLLTWGNCYAQIVWNKSGSEVLEINPIGPDVVDVRIDERTNLQVYDVYQRGDRSKPVLTLLAKEMLHVPAIGFDGICGYSQSRIAKRAVRTGMAVERETERFALRGFRAPGAIRMQPGKKFGTKQEGIAFVENFKALHMQGDSSLKVVVLQDGMEWIKLGVDPEAAQALETQKFTRGEIAGMYHVPPHMIGDVEKSTSWGTGIEEQVDGLIKFALSPWGGMIEAEINRKCFGGSNEMYAEHLYAALERANLAKRTAAYKEQILIGMLSPNEARSFENQNPHPGGDVYLIPMNYTRVDADGNDIAPPESEQESPSPGQPKEPPADANAAALRASILKGAVGASGRCLRKEGEQAKRAAGDPGGFCAWLDAFYGKHTEMVADHLGPWCDAWQAAFGSPPFGVVQHVERSRAELLAAADGPPAGFAERVAKVVEKWQGERLADVASSGAVVAFVIPAKAA